MEKKSANNRTGLEVAVIGMSLRFPGAKTIEAFWDNLKNGKESISFFTDQELEEAGISPETLRDPNYVKAGGIIEDKDKFDAAFFDYIPSEAEVMDPQTRMFHECMWEALEHAGYEPGNYKGTIGLYAGSGNFVDRELRAIFSETGKTMGQFDVSNLCSKDCLPTLVAYKLNLTGPAVPIHTACSTSLVAIHMAYRALLTGECDMAAAGGATLASTTKSGYLYQEGMILSPDGYCRAFDAGANGTVGGEGIGVVLLKRLKNALADGDTIHAVIKGSAINNDGVRKAGFTAPGVEGQYEVIRKAHHMSRFESDSITYVETHGTGTVLGDPIEMKALTLAFNSDKRNHCAVGSVKPNIGHLDTAAGVAGFIKTVLSLKHKMIPPSLNFETPNPGINFADSPFYVNTRLKQWDGGPYPLRAGVSSFGIGGTNAHVVLEEWTGENESIKTGEEREYKLVLLSARSSTALEKSINNLAGYLGNNPGLNLSDAAYTLQVGRKDFNHRAMCVASGTGEAAGLLNAPEQLQFHVKKKEKPEVVFMFPGQGSQYIGMGFDLYRTEPLFREEMDNCFNIFRRIMGYDLKELLYPAADRSDFAADSEKLTRIELTTPLTFIIEYALARLMMKWGIQPCAMIGHSLGEYAAACISGVLSLEDAVKAVSIRGQLMQKMPGGAMLGISLPEDETKCLLNDKLSLAAVNSPSHCVVSGAVEAVDSFEELLEKRGLQYRRLHISHAGHSEMMDPILREFENEISRLTISEPRIPYISNVSGKPVTAAEIADPHYWGRHLRRTVRFHDGITALSKEYPSCLFLEVGPGNSLSTFVRQFLDGQKSTHRIVNLLRHPKEEAVDDKFLLSRIGQLWLYGVCPDWQAFHQVHNRKRVPLPTYPFQGRAFRIEGDVMETVAGMLKRESSSEKKPDIADWFYAPVWEQSLWPAQHSSETAQAPDKSGWMVFTDTFGLGSLLIEQLKQEGEEVIIVKQGTTFQEEGTREFVINPGEEEHYKRMFARLIQIKKIPANIVHLWRVTGERRRDSYEELLEKLDDCQNSGFYSLFYIARAIGSHRITEKIQIDVVTDGMLEVVGGESLHPDKAGLLGAVKIIPLEYPNIYCRCIDIVLPESPDLEKDNLVTRLTDEFRAGPIDDTIVVAYRGNYRWVQSYKPVRPNKIKESLPVFRERGVYFITGGFGGMGFTLAGYLAVTFRARIVLIGRSSFPAREDWKRWLSEHALEDKTSLKIRKIQEFESSGAEVMTFCADVADYPAMKQVVREVEERFGPVNGVFHTAGIGDYAGIIQKRTREQTEQVMAPKIKGTLVLNALLDRSELDFLMLFSSLGNVSFREKFGQVGYMAGNEFLDAFAYFNRSLDNVFTTTVNWCDWKEVGMALDAIEKISSKWTGEKNETFEKLSLSPSEGVEVVRLVLGNKLQRVVISTSDLGALLEELKTIEEKLSAGEEAENDSPLLEQRPDMSTVYIAPRDETEQALVGIWGKFFGIENVGVVDDFFELGGDSLKAMTLIALIQRQMNVQIPLAEMFKSPTIRDLSLFISSAEQSVYEDIPLVEKQEYYPQSPAQRRLFFLGHFGDVGTSYNTSFVLEARGKLDGKKLEQVAKSLLERHEILRTSFHLVADEPVQVVHDHVDFELEYYSPGTGEEESENDRLYSVIKSFVRPFDFARAPLFRMGVVEISGDRFLLMCDMHHIVTDGFSNAVLVEDFERFFGGETVAPLKIQYKDFSVWQNRKIQSGQVAAQVDYWKSVYPEAGDIPKLNLPLDYPRPAVFTFKGERYSFFLSEEDTSLFRNVARENGATLYLNMLAAFNVLLYKYTGQEDIIVGGVISGRRHPDLLGIIGMFVNTLALRNSPRGDKTYREFLEEVKASSLNAFENQDVPFETLLKHLDMKRDPSRNPLFDVCLVVHEMEQSEKSEKSLNRTMDAAFSLYNFEHGVSQFDLTVDAFDQDREIIFNIEYCTALFKPDTIKRLSGHFINIIKTIDKDPGIRLSDIDVLGEEETRRVLYEFNDTAAVYPEDKTIHALFEAQVEKTPENIAVVSALKNNMSHNTHKSYMTYNHLNQTATQLSLMLRERGVTPGSVVGIMAERSIGMVAGLLGILKAGAAYLPIDPGLPEERKQYMLDDSGAATVLTHQDLSDVLTLCADTESTPGNVPVSSSDLAYIMYTSGSTGKPKGVLVEHRGVVNVVTWFGKAYNINTGTRVLQLTEYTFDPSVEDVFATLIHGGTLFTGSKEIIMDRDKFCDYVDENGIHLINFIPALLKELLCHERKLESLQTVVCGGEALPESTRDEIIRRGYRLYNHYGPTEITVDALAGECSSGPVHLGKPLSNTNCYILDAHRKPVPIGVTGELYISGAGVARGYLNNPELTAERFISLALYHSTPLPLYRTGDLACWLPDGNVRFQGRIDTQVKIRGYRIELEEIEKHLENYDGIKEASVLAREDETHNGKLYAYLTGAFDKGMDISALRAYLAAKLPVYMIPSYFIHMQEFPLTPTGKVDRNALLEYQGEIIGSGNEYQAPDTGLEEILASLWREVLGVEQVGVYDNFFEIGGDSIKAIQFSSRLNQYHLKLEISDLFAYPTLKQLVDRVRSTVSDRIPEQGAIEGRIPLTPIQEWFFQDNSPRHSHYNQAIMLYKESGFQKDLLEKLFAKIVEHHDALRMVYRFEDNTVVQYNRGVEEPLFDLEVLDFTDSLDTTEEIEEAATAIQGSINLETGPLMKLGLFKTNRGDHLLIAVHHLVIDGISWRILLTDIAAGYTGLQNGEPVRFQEKTDSFLYWSQKQVEYSKSPGLLSQLDYWRSIDETVVPSLPKDFEAGAEEKKNSSMETVAMSLSESDTANLLKDVNRAYNTEINDILLAALGMAFIEWGGLDKVLINLEGHGREAIISDVDITRTVGWFTSQFPVILDIDRANELSECIKSVKETLRKIPSKGIGYGILRYITPPEEKDGYIFHSEPEISFNYLGRFDGSDEQDGVFTMSPLKVGESISPELGNNFSISIDGIVTNGKLELYFQYNRYEFMGNSIEQLVGIMESRLMEIIRHCMNKEDVELTVSDYSASDLDEQELEDIFEDF